MDELLVLLLLVGLAPILLYRKWLRSRLGAADLAVDTLRRRYASGEITREQFEEMMKVLTGEPSGSSHAGRR